MLRDRLREGDSVPFSHLPTHRIQLARTLAPDGADKPALSTKERQEPIFLDRPETNMHLVPLPKLSRDRNS